MIAICMLGWNGADHSRRCLESIQRNSAGHDVRFFLMDNGSEDNTYDTFRSFKPTSLLQNKDNESIYRGWNRLLREASLFSPELYILANNDVVVGPGWLDAAMREVRKPGLRYFLPNGNVGSLQTLDADVLSARASLPQATIPARAAWWLMLPPATLPIFLPVPEELMLWYGDDFVHTKLQAAGYICECIMDCCAIHIGSVSVLRREGYVDIIEKDRQFYKSLMGALP